MGKKSREENQEMSHNSETHNVKKKIFVVGYRSDNLNSGVYTLHLTASAAGVRDLRRQSTGAQQARGRGRREVNTRPLCWFPLFSFAFLSTLWCSDL